MRVETWRHFWVEPFRQIKTALDKIRPWSEFRWVNRWLSTEQVWQARGLMTPFELKTPDRKFECGNCGRCCKIWHVELLPADVKRLADCKWQPGDPGPENYLSSFNGTPVLAHKADGGCVFYDEDNNGCEIHRRFGYAAKPVGCRLYPFQLATTFSNTVSTTIRFECPSVRKNAGKPLVKRSKELRDMALEMGLPGLGFSKSDLAGLEPVKCRQIVDGFLAHVLNVDEPDGVQRLIAAQLAVPRLEKLGTAFINDMDMNDILPSFFDRVMEDAKLLQLRRLGALEQARFLSLFLSFMRRDEEQLGMGLSGRIKRTMALFKLLYGKINLHDLSSESPDFALSRTEFYASPVENRNTLPLGHLYDLMRLRLESFQFFGQPVYGRSFHFGLSTLFMVGGLVVALAKWNAMARNGRPGSCTVTEDDVANAVSAIHHAYGRSQLLGLGFMTTLQRQVCDANAFARILTEVTVGTHGR